MAASITKVKLIGGIKNGLIFYYNKNPDLCKNFKMDSNLIYEIEGEKYRPIEIKDGCLILKAERGYIQ